jgi:hypothetical protein
MGLFNAAAAAASALGAITGGAVADRFGARSTGRRSSMRRSAEGSTPLALQKKGPHCRPLPPTRLRRSDHALFPLFKDGDVIVRAILDRVVENRLVGRQPGNGQFVDIVLEQAAVQEVPRNMVEPQALAQVVKFVGRFHRVISRELHCRASVAGGLGFGHRFLLS